MTQEIEDDEHFLIRCDRYKNERNEIFGKLSFPTYYKDQEKMVSMLTNTDVKSIQEITQFIRNCFKQREDYIKGKQPAVPK